MPDFTEAETDYLTQQRLGRIATVGADGSPHVVPVGFRVRPELGVIDIGGHDLTRTKKWRDLEDNPQVAFVVDDLASVDPWRPRGVEVRGTAELHRDSDGSPVGGGAWIRITPDRILAWGLDTGAFAAANARGGG